MNGDLMELAQVMLQAGVIGYFMPIVVAAVVRTRWASWAKALTALAISLLVGTFTAWASGDLVGLAWPAAVATAMAATQHAYRKWWHPTGVAPLIEALTNRTKVIDGEVASSETVPIEPSVNAEIGSSGGSG